MSKETLDPYLIVDQEAQSRLDVENPSSSRRCSLMSDHLEAQKCGMSVLKTYNSIGFGFHIGDMVWGKVKSHPWWPGHIYNETFASSSVRRTKREGHVLVAFFGDSSYGWFELAELVHFDSNFFEKSRQTTAKNFVKAVDEAVDEASRRAALGLICRCRNPYNFRSVNITGYFAVNVLDYDVGIYSSSQIIQARENFQPEKTLDFVKDLALIAYGESRSIESIKQKATVLIYRKIVFEEFDETYAQAFGIQPVRPSRELTCKMDPSPGASSRAPLSGPMVFAETKPAKVKNSNKRDRYLFKRRDEFKKDTDEHSDDHILQKKDGADSIILQKQYDADHIPSSFLHDPKEEEEAIRIQSPVLLCSEAENGVLLQPIAIPLPDLKNTHSLDGDGGPDFSSIVVDDEEMKPGGMNATQSKGCKHPNDDQSYRKGIPPEKKKKLMKETEREDGGSTAKEEKSEMVMEEQVIPDSIAVASFSVAENIDSDPWKLLLDLKSLALDPFHGADRKSQLFVEALVLNFRSAVYQKSLVLSPPPEKDNSDLPRRIEEQKDPPPPCKQLKVPEFRSSDPTKSGRKRGLHHKNEEKTAKKTKKLSDLKVIPAERRTKQKPKEEAKKQSSPLRFPPSIKPKPPNNQSLMKIEDPAMLVIKFPGKTAIPSIGELKVKFSRFGQLDPEGTRVFWNTNTCRVVFRHKSDALAAHKHTIESKSFFANAAVKCQLRDIEPSPSPSPPCLSHNPHHPSSTPLKLKSCLKKTTGSPASTAATTAARGVSRVKFILEEESAIVGECNRGKIESEQWNYNSMVEENVDISMQMFTLLRRCSEIVASLKSFLGYLPYRPL